MVVVIKPKKYVPPKLDYVLFETVIVGCVSCGADLSYDFMHDTLWCGCVNCSGLGGDFNYVYREKRCTC